MIGDDLTPFFVPGEFSHADDTLAGAPVLGIFDAEYVSNGGGFGMADARPAYMMATAQVPVESEGILLVHKGESYRVAASEPDGTGITVLMLERT